ncbi:MULTISPECIES: hypothetical protein [Staphylococcus]|uniref:hypothetical protein n=2 Tax=Staphylococcus TaxID=1279 RepID=UPI001AEBDCC0|nr:MULTISPECIES: hypothetical protein [Staphylococcus]MCQ9901975.1 hypothetical protein [Staphylococcus aureus]
MILMIINRGGTLGVAYFKSYSELILSPRISDLDEAEKSVFQRLFNNTPRQLGNETYQQFLQAHINLANNE